jgi:AraC-like DNA-binding protein
VEGLVSLRGPVDTRGILRAREGLRRFELRRHVPSAALAPLVSHFWIVAWDLRGQAPHTQVVLPHPCVNVTFLPGRCQVSGIPRAPHRESLHGAGRVLGVMFRPGGFRPLLGRSLTILTDRVVPVSEIFGPAGDAVSRAVLAASDDAGMVAAFEHFLRPRVDAVAAGGGSRLATVDQVAGIVERVAADPTILRVDHLADQLGIGVRRLQRLCTEHIGVGPKWIIRRYRLHEATARMAQAGTVGCDWARLAVELGYSDQAHFVRDFTATIGVSPARYARETASTTARATEPTATSARSHGRGGRG